MINLRIKIDVWSQGIDERIRERNRQLLIDTYMGFPPARVWYYLKHVSMHKKNDLSGGMLLRQKSSKDIPDVGESGSNEHLSGPEDVVAKG
jgi:hypothetical protein